MTIPDLILPPCALVAELPGRGAIGATRARQTAAGPLDETCVPPERLAFEVAEIAAIANLAHTTAFAQRLAELGCQFALDDFGASLGSFYHLKHLPFDYLKIDGEFVRRCAENATDRILISAVVRIAHRMGKRTIAEHVEDQETVEVLTRLGVDHGQGFHLGRPAPLEQQLAAAAAQPPVSPVSP